MYRVEIRTAPHQSWQSPMGWSADTLTEGRLMAREAYAQWMHVRLRDTTTGRIVDHEPRYLCKGSVRGWCGRKHLTLAAAERCLRADQRECKRAGGYSDRWIIDADTGRVVQPDEIKA